MKRIAVVAGLLVALAAVATVGVGGAGATTQTNDTGASDGSLGAEITSFMQASSAEAESEVEDGMFEAGLNRTDDLEERRALIERRRERLQQRQEQLAERRAEISAADGTGPKDVALATHVDVGATRLERSANGTQRAAEAAGLNTAALDKIRRNASELRSPGVSNIVRDLADGPERTRGPPGDAPEQANRSASEATTRNRSDGRGQERGQGQGPPGDDDPGADPASGSGGSDDEAREGNRGESDGTGPPDEPGNDGPDRTRGQDGDGAPGNGRV